MLEYSRDAMAGPLRSLAKVLKDIANNIFDPDATRSGRFKGTAAGSSGSTQGGRGSKRSAPTVDVEMVLYLHSINKKVHMVCKGDKVTLCGKKLNKLFHKYLDDKEDGRATYCEACLAS